MDNDFDLEGYMPIGMLGSLVLTIAYRPDYRTSRIYADEFPAPETVVVHGLDINKFLMESQLNLGLEEFVDFEEEELDTLRKYVETYKGYCPYIVNAMFVDHMGKVSVVESLDAQSNFPSAASMR